jgi:hypothetical protein
MKLITLELTNGSLVSLYLSNTQNLSIVDCPDTYDGRCILWDGMNADGWYIKCSRVELINKLRDYN